MRIQHGIEFTLEAAPLRRHPFLRLNPAGDSSTDRERVGAIGLASSRDFSGRTRLGASTHFEASGISDARFRS